jgi:IMP dehydrogenase
MNILPDLGLTFDDVLLVPQASDLKSRSEVSTATRLGTLDLNIPIVSANMDTITEVAMAKAMAAAGGLGILHRFADHETVIGWMSELTPEYRVPSVGVNTGDYYKLEEYRPYTSSVCVDVAHGDSNKVVNIIRAALKLGYINIIAGNVATTSATYRLIEAGANIIKVGVGPGSMCTTRIVTGHGVPQLTAIADVRRAIDIYTEGDIRIVSLIADGGIRNSGDVVKALGAGADAVMIGSLLAGTLESPSAHMGVYRGMASESAQVGHRGKVSNGAPEGVMKPVKLKGPVKDVLDGLVGGIRSGLSYTGVRTIKEFQENAMFMRISANGLKESHPHGLDF